MIIDFHTHCFPDTLAPRAIESLKNHVLRPDLFPTTDGTRAGTERLLAAKGVNRGVVCNIATNPRQQQNVNSFAISLTQAEGSLYPPGSPISPVSLIPLGSLHPLGEKKHAELERLAAAGIRGIKIHPDYIGTDIDSPEYDEIFSLCSELDMFVLTHAGFDPYSPGHMHAPPKKILRVHRRYPRLRLIAAHMGGFACGEGSVRCLLGEDIWLDTSMSSQRPREREILFRILREHPADRLLFGSDTPWSYISAELNFVRSASLDDERLEKILYKNAQGLLGGNI